MIQLFKEHLRAIRKNKLTTIVIIFLIFLSASTFSLFSNTLNNFTKSVDAISEKGNLHDFTIKEKYRTDGNFESLYSKSNTADPQDKCTGIGSTCTIDVNYDNFTGAYLDTFGTTPQFGGRLVNAPYGDFTWSAGAPTGLKPKGDIDPKLSAQISNLKGAFSSNLTTFEQSVFFKDLQTHFQSLEMTNRLALDVSSSKDGNFYKIVNTSPDNLKDKKTNQNIFNNYNSIDKLVMQEGQEVKSFNDYFKTNFSGDGTATDASWGTTQVRKLAKANNVSDANFAKYYSCDKVFRCAYSDTASATPVTISIDDPTSYFTVISNSFASKHNIKPVSNDQFENLLNSYKALLEKEAGTAGTKVFTSFYDFLQSQNISANNTIKVDNTEMVVVGVGITPDYMYPIMDTGHVLPNLEREAILYSNNAAFYLYKDAYAGNNTENFFEGKVPGVSKSDILNYINKSSYKYMSWPNGIYSAYWYDDKNENYLLAPLRITVIYTLLSQIRNLSIVSMIILLILTSFIVIIIFRKDIKEKQTSFGILKSNGYRTRIISFSYLCIPLFTGLIGTIMGYFVGLLLQGQSVKIFSSFWTLPDSRIDFDLFSFLLTVAIPIIFLSGLIFFTCLKALYKNPLKLIKNADNIKPNFLIRHTKKITQNRSVIVKFSFSFMFQSTLKFLLLLTSVSLTTGITIFGLSSISAYKDTLEATQKVKDYEYKVTLNTPSFEGGPIGVYDWAADSLSAPKTGTPTPAVDSYKSVGQEGWDSLNFGSPEQPLNFFDWYNRTDATAPVPLISRLQTPVLPDVQTAKTAVDYLRNLVQTKSSLDSSIIGNNPWSLAYQLMPTNQRNAASIYDTDYNRTLYSTYMGNPARYENKFNQSDSCKTAIIAKDAKTVATDCTWIPNDLSKDNNSSYKDYTFNPSMKTPAVLFMSQEYISLMKDGFQQAGIDPNKNPYKLSYDHLGLEKGDETFTSVDATLLDKQYPTDTKIDIIGINPNTKSINIGSALDELKSAGTQINPIVVSKLDAEKYHLSKGSTIDINQNNWIYRFINPTIAPQVTKDLMNQFPQKTQYTVVGIFDSYFGSDAYTLQSVANKTLGMNNPLWDHYYGNPGTNTTYGTYQCFNGYFSKDPNLISVSHQFGLYSYLGIYPATDRINISNYLNMNLQEDDLFVPTHNNTEFDILNKFTGLDYYDRTTSGWKGKTRTPEFDAAFLKLANQYSLQTFSTADSASILPYTAMTNDIQSRDIDGKVASQIFGIANSAQYALISIIFSISIMIVIIITHSIVIENRKNIATFKAMGYSDKSVTNLFLGMYLPIAFMGSLLALPIGYGIILGIQKFILDFGNVYVLFPITWWIFIGALVPILLLFITTYFISRFDMKKRGALRDLNEN